MDFSSARRANESWAGNRFGVSTAIGARHAFYGGAFCYQVTAIARIVSIPSWCARRNAGPRDFVGSVGVGLCRHLPRDSRTPHGPIVARDTRRRRCARPLSGRFNGDSRSSRLRDGMTTKAQRHQAGVKVGRCLAPDFQTRLACTCRACMNPGRAEETPGHAINPNLARQETCRAHRAPND